MAQHTLILPNGDALSSGKMGPAIRYARVISRIWEGREKFPGAVCAAVAEIEIMDARECPLSPGEEFMLLKDGEQVGIFLVEEREKDGFACWRITAYDRVRKLDKRISLPEEECSLWELAHRVCRLCGVVLAESMPHPSALRAAIFPKGEGNHSPLWGGWPSKARSGEVTGRQVMKYIAREMGCYARMNPKGTLEFIQADR